MIINQSGVYLAGFHVTFYSFFGRILGEYDTGYLAIRKTRDFKIPKNTYRVHVYMAIAGGKKRHFDFYADESVVNEKSRIELTSTKTSLHPKFDVKFNNGWSEKKPEYKHRGIIQFNSVADCYYSGSFKATFYKDDQKLGEESLDLSNHPREAIKIPDNTNRIEAAISGAQWEWSSEIYDSATLKLDGNKATSMDVITINFGGRLGYWTPMEITCPNWWGLFGSAVSRSAKRGSIQFKSYFNADNPNMYFKATFYNDNYRKISEKSVKLSNLGKKYRSEAVVDSEAIKIPNGINSIKVEVIKEGIPIDNATLACISDKDLEDDITITLGDTLDGSWEAMRFNCPNGWERSESTKKMSRGTIQLNSNFEADNRNMYLKATFYLGAYGYNQKIDETSVKLLTLRELRLKGMTAPYGKTIGIPCGTNSVKVEIIKEGQPIDSATFELRRDKTVSEDAIKIDLGNHLGEWEAMRFNYPECWQKI